MMKWTVGALLVLAGIAPTAAQESQSGVHLQTSRFWRNGQTLVEGTIGLRVRPDDSGSVAQVTISVRDSSGNVLHSEQWADTVSPRMAEVARVQGGAEIRRPFSFALAPGLYDLSATVRRGSRADSANVRLRGFADAPVISDLLLSARIRALPEGQEPVAGEIRKGRYAIEQSPQVRLYRTDPNLWYYIELYPSGSDSSQTRLEFAVIPAGSQTPVFRTARMVSAGSRGTVDAARIPLAGLPPGEYRLQLQAAVDGRTTAREAWFSMAALDEAPVAVAAPAAPSGGSAEEALYQRYFAPTVRSDSAIRQIVEAMTLAPPGSSLQSGAMNLSADEQRRLLAWYWARMPDPQPATAQQEFLEEYVGRVEYVSREYREQLGRSGVRTDRGRIYLRWGPPDLRQQLPVTANRAVEIWKYTRNRDLKYAFLDETGFQNFNLVYTTDPQERSLPDWQERVSDLEMIRQILAF